MKEQENIKDDIAALIVDDLEGILKPDEKLKLDQWRAAGPRNEELYQEFCKVSAEMEVLGVRESLNVDQSWNTLEAKLDATDVGTGKEERSGSIGRPVIKWWLAAASVVLCLAYYFHSINSGMITISTASAQSERVVLPDGSVVLLNENTEIRYSARDFNKERTMQLLKGEAFFSVEHNPGRKFSIGLGRVNAVDLGTSFNVTRKGDDVTVIVQSGLVALTHSGNSRQVVLKAGMKGYYLNGEDRLADTPNVDANYKSWADKKLIFVNAPLPDVIKQLENTYHTSLALRGKGLKSRKLTASLHYQTIDSALVIVSASLHCKVKKTNNTYVLSD